MRPYRYGDVCVYCGKSSSWTGKHIIHEVNHTGDDEYEYSTTEGAWIAHKDLVLVKESTKLSRRKLHEAVEDEF